MFVKVDATQIEINPWAVTPDLDVYCVGIVLERCGYNVGYNVFGTEMPKRRNQV